PAKSGGREDKAGIPGRFLGRRLSVSIRSQEGKVQVAEGIRLNKYLSDIGVCSRRAADRLAQEGRITVNGTAAEPGMRVTPQDVILVDGKPVRKEERKVYLALNKPRGIVCTA